MDWDEKKRLTETAAKLLGIEIKHWSPSHPIGKHQPVAVIDHAYFGKDYYPWDPAESDHDSLRLAVAAGLIAPGCWPNPGHIMGEMLRARNGKPVESREAGYEMWAQAQRYAILRAVSQQVGPWGS